MLERITGEKPPPGKYPVDTLLASNMISVGVDVDRLGLMVVNGQPVTAEYIRATSRVGRCPRLVVTVYNWTRPATRATATLPPYHSALYRHEQRALPFSSRARDKALERSGIDDPAATPR